MGVAYADGEDVGEWLVAAGHAFAMYDPRYRNVERRARRAGRGLWSHRANTDPREWRHRDAPKSDRRRMRGTWDHAGGRSRGWWKIALLAAGAAAAAAAVLALGAGEGLRTMAETGVRAAAEAAAWAVEQMHSAMTGRN